jgi:hypothetical protein
VSGARAGSCCRSGAGAGAQLAEVPGSQGKPSRKAVIATLVISQSCSCSCVKQLQLTGLL